MIKFTEKKKKSQKEARMVILVDKFAEKETTLPQVNEDFDNFITKQLVKTTFNGIEVAPFSWYKKFLSGN